MILEDTSGPELRRQTESMDTMSIEELEARIAFLNAEIDQCRQAIARKLDVRNAADAFFARPAG
jgi:uncharacterized small protein (DUF1192 family)